MDAVIFKPLLALCLGALLLLSACSEQPGEPDQRQTDAAARGGAGEKTKARTLPEKGMLSPGRYSTEGEFEPSFSFELIGEGWRVLPSMTSNSLKLGYLNPDAEVAEGKALRFTNVREVFEPREQEENEVSFEVKPAPQSMVSWIEHHPYLSTDKPQAIDIGGVDGKRFDVRVNVPEGYRDDHGGGCALPCIPLFRLSSESVSHITEKGEDRLVVLEDLQGKTVVIITSVPFVKSDRFLPKAQKVLDTIEWEGT